MLIKANAQRELLLLFWFGYHSRRTPTRAATYRRSLCRKITSFFQNCV